MATLKQPKQGSKSGSSCTLEIRDKSPYYFIPKDERGRVDNTQSDTHSVDYPTD